MLEEKIDALIAALKANTAALGGKAGAAGAAGKTAAAGGSKVTFDMVKAAVVKVKDAKGKPAAQKIIRDAGKASELAAIKAPQYEAVIAASEAALAEEEAPAEDEDTL